MHQALDYGTPWPHYRPSDDMPIDELKIAWYLKRSRPAPPLEEVEGRGGFAPTDTASPKQQPEEKIQKEAEFTGDITDPTLFAESVSMDIWQPYIKGARIYAPDADIVRDRYHVAAYLGGAVDAVRRAEHRELMKAGDETLEKTRYSWLTRFDDPRCFPASFRSLYRSALKTSKAWGYKELLDRFWGYVSEARAEKCFNSGYRSVIHTRIEPMTGSSR